MAGFVTSRARSLSSLCITTRDACAFLSSMVFAFYSASRSNEITKLKSDSSEFTIADGIVQHLLIDHLFKGKFNNIIGEEDDSRINILTKPYTVDEIIVPDTFHDVIDCTKRTIDQMSYFIDCDAYMDINVFIDPIDGTKEFCSGEK